MRQPLRNRELQVNLPVVTRPLDRELAPLPMQLLFDPVRRIAVACPLPSDMQARELCAEHTRPARRSG
jgi:hypothetical protein